MSPRRFEKLGRILLILLCSLVILGCVSWGQAFVLSFANLERLVDDTFGPPKNVTPDLAPNSPSEATALPELDEGPAGKLVTARGSFELDTQVKTDPLGGGTRSLEGPIELSFYPEGGPVTGNGSLVYEAWAKGCPPGRFEHTAKFTGTSFPDGTAKGTVEVINLVNRTSNCVYDSVELKISLAWEAHFSNGIFEGQVINNDGTTLPFKLAY